MIPFIADYVMSPDGREFIGTAPSRQMFRYSVTGGNSRPLPPDVPATPWVAWAEDGSLWLGSGFASTGLTRVGADGAVSKPFGNQHGNLGPVHVFPATGPRSWSGHPPARRPARRCCWICRRVRRRCLSIAPRVARERGADRDERRAHRNYDVSPDGTTFVMVRFNPATRIMLIQNLPALVSQLRGTSR